MSTRSSRLQLLAAALLFSTGGTAVKAISLTSWQLVSARSLVAALVLLAVTGASAGHDLAQPLLVGVARPEAVGITFVVANKLTTAANAVFLQATAPLYIALLGPLLLGERFKRRDLPLLCADRDWRRAALRGLAGAAGHRPQPHARHARVGIVSGFCWSLTVMGIRWLSRRDADSGGMASGAAAISGNLLAAAIAAPFAFPLPAIHAAIWPA